MEKTKQRFDLALRTFIKKQGSNKRVAQKLEVNPSKISKLLNTDAMPSFSFLASFFTVAKVNPNWVFFGDGQMLIKKV